MISVVVAAGGEVWYNARQKGRKVEHERYK